MQIIILGMHRSGTSVTTRIVNMMGAYIGPENSLSSSSKDNPKGFWERPEIFKLNNALLASQGCTWHNLQQWTFTNAHTTPDDIARKIKGIVHDMDAFRPWVLKDPRLCLLLPAWLPCLEVPVAVIVYRHPIEIALSLQKRDCFSLEYGIALWEYYMVSMLNATQHIPRIFVQHADFMQTPYETSKTLYDQLVAQGVRRLEMPTAKEIEAFIDPTLYRSKPAQEVQCQLTPEQEILMEILRGERSQQGNVHVSRQASLCVNTYGSRSRVAWQLVQHLGGKWVKTRKNKIKP